MRTRHLLNIVLFRDAAGHLCLRLPYRYVHEDTRQDPPFLRTAWQGCAPRPGALSSGVPARAPHANYWQHKHNFYTGPWVLYPGQYFFVRLGRRGQVRLLADPDFARCRGRFHYLGVRVPGDTVPRAEHYP